MSTFNRAQVIDDNFVNLLKGWSQTPARRLGLDGLVVEGSSLTGRDAVELLESQMICRHLDLIARWLRAKDAAFYTIGSAGHEGNAVVARLTRQTDPAFLHYRSGAFVAERSRKVPGIDIIYDIVLSQAASAEDPIAGGRHKVWGSVPLWILPQTSTIASQLPKAVGTAIAIQRARHLARKLPIPEDSIAICSFGDASCNHSTAQGAFNSAQWAAYQRLPVPVLFVCEDNGIGISVHTPTDWIETSFSQRPGIRYFRANGLDLANAYEIARQAVDYCRSYRAPTFLHLKVVRMLGHAGSDFEPAYHSMEEIASAEARDPLVASAKLVLDAGLMTASEMLAKYEELRTRTAKAAERVVTRPRLATKQEVMAPLAPYHADAVQEEARRADYQDKRIDVFGGESKLPERLEPRHLAVQINAALFDLMAKYPETVLFGEDVAQKGGVYYATAGLFKKFKAARVFNTLLDEQTILGLAQGFANMGLLPLPEIQYLAYFHNACDQIRGEACSLQFFSQNQYRNPMVIRIASLGYQKGFGGHFHNDNSIAALRDIPSLIVACPTRGDDAAAMLRTCLALAKIDGRVVAFLEPIALYMTKDLYESNDGKWQFAYPPPEVAVPLGQPRVYEEGACDVAIITFGNGVFMSLRAAERLKKTHQLAVRVVDLRWLSPLNTDAISQHAGQCGAIVVVDEGRRSGGVGEGIMTALIESGLGGKKIRRIVGDDTYIPLGPAANLVLPSEEAIEAAILDLTGR
ncbi:MAG TPA: thiamine pyrophosphate-dependent enzyme [Phycisphaerae bacterium]|nr:thiamine pyrophosphate-dependent enzyme [Phycisphaerae bacterium]